MKKLFYFSMFMLFTAAFLVSCGGSSDKSNIVGTWQMESVSGETLSESEKSITMTFDSDGSAFQTNGEREKKGTWELKEKDGKKYFCLISDDRTEEFELISLDNSKLVIKEGDDIITLKKK